MRGFFVTTGFPLPDFAINHLINASIPSSPCSSKGALSSRRGRRGLGGRGSSEESELFRTSCLRPSASTLRFAFLPFERGEAGGGRKPLSAFSSFFFSAGGSLTLFFHSKRMIFSNSFSEAGIRKKRDVQLDEEEFSSHLPSRPPGGNSASSGHLVWHS
ncbi:hypothetical protein TNCV_3472291 [Trichonephila clavipes]|nr:hypothetical protein TNCV_3472291 [Trichonephila clavipes]